MEFEVLVTLTGGYRIRNPQAVGGLGPTSPGLPMRAYLAGYHLLSLIRPLTAHTDRTLCFVGIPAVADLQCVLYQV